MKFGKINQYILFGGGELLCRTAQKLKQESFPLFVVTSERHAIEPITIDGAPQSFLAFLQAYHIEHGISKDITSDPAVLHRITEHTIGISFGAAWIFRNEFISRFNGKLLNCHGAQLPQDRGAGGFSWRILRGDRTGVSLIHQIDAGVDTGDIIISEKYIYPDACRYPVDYQNYSIKQYQTLLNTFLTLVKDEKPFTCTTQDEALSSYWPRLATDIHGYMDWSWGLADLERFVCAFDDPYKGASTFLNGRKVRIKKCHSSLKDGVFHPFQEGLIYRILGDDVFVATRQGTLNFKSVSDENGIDIKQDLRVGERFYTPVKYLEEAKQFRAIYTPAGLKIDQNSTAG